MSMLSVLIKDLVEKTTLEDGTYLVAGTTDANKITFLNLVNAIKKKLGSAAQKNVANNLTTEEAGTSVLDAYQGKLLSDKIDELNSTLKYAIKFVDYQVTLDSNAYVAPFSYYANNYLPISDIEKYGTPISATLMTSSGQAHPVALTLMSNGKYHYTCVATAAKGVMTVVFLKLN
ncbi:MAG: hypothetical protein SPL91_05295 [Oliverpabstia intestinalis]|nr:hypothetical protein [Oliverpabstia intestinalis]MDY5790900.1 hypothetical protein [Oliverpabstia intestinalis]